MSESKVIEFCPTCRQPIIPDAMAKLSAGNSGNLPLCEPCAIQGEAVTASFIVDRTALCLVHWRERLGRQR